jgi:hypothetical protein
LAGKEELNGMIEAGDERSLRDPALEGSLLRRATALLASDRPKRKWQAVKAIGVIAAGLDTAKLEDHVRRFLWALNDESGAVPHGVPEALGEIAAVRPELKERIVPILVSCVVAEDTFQTGPILAGAIWALGRTGIENDGEKERLLPGLSAALGNADPEVRETAVATAERLGIPARPNGEE